MRDLRGMHYPNERVTDLERFYRAASGGLTVLHHQLWERTSFPGLDQWGDRAGQLVYGRARYGPGGDSRIIHVRGYHPNWEGVDPTAWGRHLARQLRSWRPAFGGPGPAEVDLWADPLVMLSVANETNIEQRLQRTRQDYIRQADWHRRVYDAIEAEVPDRRALLVWSAFAQGHDPWDWDARRQEWRSSNVPDGEYTIPEVRDAIKRCEVLASHPYGHLDAWPDGRDVVGDARFWGMLRSWRPEGFRDRTEPHLPHDPGGILAQFPGMAHIVTETGTFSNDRPDATELHKRGARLLWETARDDGRTILVTTFIWATDDAHPTNDLQKRPELLAFYADAPPVLTAAVVPQPRQSGGGEQPMGMTDSFIERMRAAGFGTRVADMRGTWADGYGRLDQAARARFITLHHTATSREVTPDAIAREHIQTNGWPGIGYHLIVRHGVIYVVGDLETMRAHVRGLNDVAGPGISITGSYEPGSGMTPAPEDLEVARAAVLVLWDLLGRDVKVTGHGQLLPGYTACPGSLAAIAAAWDRELHEGGQGGQGGKLAELARRWADETQAIKPNPGAALQRAAIARGFTTLLGDEGRLEVDGVRYAVQAFANPATGEEVILLLVEGRWGDAPRVIPRRP